MARSVKPVAVLDANDYDVIVSKLRELEDLPGVIGKAKACGINCDEYEQMHAYTKQALETILKTWFPKGRPR